MIDYSKYSNKELLEIVETINKDKFPDNYKKLVEEIKARNITTSNNDSPFFNAPFLRNYYQYLLNNSFIKVILERILFTIIIITFLSFLISFFHIIELGQSTKDILFHILLFYFVLILYSIASGKTLNPRANYLNDPGLFSIYITFYILFGFIILSLRNVIL